MEPIIAVRNLSKRFRAHTDIDTLFASGAGASLTAVDGVSFELGEGRDLWLGRGKRERENHPRSDAGTIGATGTTARYSLMDSRYSLYEATNSRPSIEVHR